MEIIKTILIGMLIHSCVSEVRRCKNCAQRKTDLSIEQLRKLRYEYLKNQILKKLHLTVAPRTNLPKPPLKTLLAIAKIAENETNSETEDEPKTESVVIYPRNDDFSCRENKLYSCSRFEFAVPESLSLENFLFAEVWFHYSPTESTRVYHITTNQFQDVVNTFELENISSENNVEFWRKYSVPSDKIRSNATSENVLVLEIIDVSNETDSNVTIEKIDDKPLLVIRMEKIEEVSRNRRSNCGESSTSCCRENFFLNFSEIGWDNWILHPDGYQANFCRGHCFNDLSNTRFYHSAVLLSFIRDNKDIAEEIGLNMCCTPSVMAPVTIIYRNEEGFIYHKSIDNMKVEACDCA